MRSPLLPKTSVVIALAVSTLAVTACSAVPGTTALPVTAERTTLSGQVLPASGQVLPASGQVLPASGQVLPASGQVLPGSGQVLPASGQVLPGSGQVLPASTSAPKRKHH